MPQVVYYIPKTRSAPAPVIAAAGLDYALTEGATAVRPVDRGPDDGGGVLVADNRIQSDDLIWTPGDQQWQPMITANGDRPPAWAGICAGRRPGPSDLALKKQAPGNAVTLGDGQSWIIPAAVSNVRESPIPQTMSVDGQGNLIKTAVERFAKLQDYGERIFAQYRRDAERAAALAQAPPTEPEEPDDADELDDSISDEDAFWMAVEALSLNYRVGPVEVSLLGLVRNDLYWDGDGILAAIIDLPLTLRVIEDLAKKNVVPKPDG